VRWIAQFSDPWDGNPLERHPLIRLWSRLNEPAAVRAADCIVHTSAYALDLMMERHPAAIRRKAVVIPHAYEEALYPQRPKRRGDVITLCHAGVLFGRRSPEPLFLALARVLEKRPSLRDRLRLDLVGVAPPEMLQTPGARALPAGLVRVVGTVGYLESLQRMYDADLLVLIEANTRHNLFLSSKLLDYLGANTPIVGLAPKGASEDILADVGCWHARPDDLEGIARVLEEALDYVSGDRIGPWCREDRRRSYDNREVAARWLSLIGELSGA
jgi:glycosyltransferase involved in cell wall biosynthesis